MLKNYNTISDETLTKWHEGARMIGIPREAYNNPIKIVKDSSGKSKYSFGVVFNEYRAKRPGKGSSGQTVRCHMCRMVNEALQEPAKNLFPKLKILDLIITPNGFPVAEGASMAISSRTDEKERPMYASNKSDNLENELRALFDSLDKTGFYIFHNSPGAGATIPGHEHWQLPHWGALYSLIGAKYGFDNAEIKQCKTNNKVTFMPDFSMAHLIFDKNEPDRIVSFLNESSKGLKNIHPDGLVPHCLCQGDNGVLIVPFKKDVGRKMGSGDCAGHIFVYSQEDFDHADYNYCVRHISEGMFLKEEINLEKFL